MESIDTLITARWVIPIEPAGLVLQNHAVAVHRGQIVAVLPAAQAQARFAAAESIERPAHVLLPGFVNAHTRAAMTLLRGAAESSSLDYWLSRQVRPLELRWMDAEYVRDGTELAVADMLTSGTTCFADMHLFPEVVAQVASAAKIRACIGLPVADVPSPWDDSANECLAKGIDLHDEYRDDPLITTALAPEVDSSADETLLRVRRAADELEPLAGQDRATIAVTPAVAGGLPAYIASLRNGAPAAVITATASSHASAAVGVWVEPPVGQAKVVSPTNTASPMT